jgi:hypothetical protein
MWSVHINLVELCAIRERMAHSWFFQEPEVRRELAIPRQMVTKMELK